MGSGDHTLELLWDAIETVVSRAELRTAVATITDVVPAPGADPDAEWRSLWSTGSRWCARSCRCCAPRSRSAPPPRPPRSLTRCAPCRTCSMPARRAGYRRGTSMPARSRWTWSRQRGHGWCSPPGRPEATVHRAGYVFCVLELFHQRLRRRDIFALASGRWADPRAQLLAGSAWEAARGPVLNALSGSRSARRVPARSRRGAPSCSRRVQAAHELLGRQIAHRCCDAVELVSSPPTAFRSAP
jgi:hypothetical protein